MALQPTKKKPITKFRTTVAFKKRTVQYRIRGVYDLKNYMAQITDALIHFNRAYNYANQIDRQNRSTVLE